MWIVLPVLITLHVIVCVLMVFLVLMQRPRNEGLGAAFGGGVTDNVFGPQTANVLSKFTTYLGISFFVLTLLLAVVYARKDSGKSSIQRSIDASVPAAVAPTTAATPTPAPALPSSATPATPAPATENATTTAPATEAPATPAAPVEAAPATPAPAAPAQ